MTVEQLIARLKDYPQDAVVVRHREIRGYHECDFIDRLEIIDNRGWRNQKYGNGEFLNATTVVKTRAKKRKAVVVY